MSLRSRLVLAMAVAALLPMLVVVGVPLLRAEARVREQAESRLELARRQAAFLVARFRSDAASRVEQAALDLRSDREALEALLGGPEDAARRAARSLAERHGLGYVEIHGPGGRLLAATSAELRAGIDGPFADLAAQAPALRRLPPGSAPGEREQPLAFVARLAVPLPRETLSIAGGRIVGPDFIGGIAEITGEPAALLDPGAAEVRRVGETEAPGGVGTAVARVSAEVPVDGAGWRVRVHAHAGDARRERRDLLGTFAGIAPLALLSALVVGVLLAEGIARPIRTLASRAEEISTERSGFALVEPERDEVRRLQSSFERMLDSLAESEKHRLSAERVAAWQEVARRIAHEVKNPLSPIKLAVENLLRTREKAPTDLDRAIQEESAAILEEVEGLRRLVDEFSLFARLPAPRPAAVDPRDIVAHALALFAPRIEALGVEVETRLDRAPSSLVADAEQIGRALKNVVANALDALEGVERRRLAITVLPAGGRSRRLVEFEVRDSGRGFEPEALRRVFEPYFTTRGDRGGTGLGMAIVYRIVAEHGGSIEAAGSPGGGATIRIRLPQEGPSRARA